MKKKINDLRDQLNDFFKNSVNIKKQSIVQLAEIENKYRSEIDTLIILNNKYQNNINCNLMQKLL